MTTVRTSGVRKLEIDTEYLVQVLLELLEIPSPSGYTDTIVRFVCEQLTRLGIDHEITRRGAIRANLPGKHRSPDRALVAHVDTIGAMVTHLQSNGRLGVAPVGTWSSRFAEGARVSILTDDQTYRGTILPLKASGHTFGEEVDTQPTSWDHVEVRVDARASNEGDLVALGFQVGDYVAVDPQPEITEHNYIVSRHLDDKAGVATLLAAARAIKDAGVALPVDCHLLFTIFEEVGSGASAVLHQDVAEMVSIDNSTPAPGQNSTEYEPAISMMDSSGPFDYHLTHRLIDLASQHGVPLRRAVFRYYRSDAATAVEAGSDIRTALLCFGVDSSHGWERTHLDGLRSLGTLLTLYMQSPAVVERDSMELGPVEGFTEQPAAENLIQTQPIEPDRTD